MILSRSIGSVLRGKATPLQIAMACVLGSLIGFIPGLWQAPGLLIALFLTVAILNANLGLAALVGLVAKLLSLVLMPVQFEAGRWLLDGPTQGLFKSMINAPVLAFFGLEYYAVSGGLLLGLVFGVAVAAAVILIVRSFRRRMAGLEEGSERYRAITSKKWVRVLSYIFLGSGKGKASYEELLGRRIGNPIRPLGVVLALGVVGLLFVAQMFASEPIVTAILHNGLERANGATVDLKSASLNLRQGSLVVTGLAMADPEQLDTDLLRAARVEGNISGSDLLRKRITIDKLVVSDAQTGQKRQLPGRLVGPRPAPAPKPPPDITFPDAKQIEDFIKQAEKWKQRLSQAKRWLEQVAKKKEGTTKQETLKERLAREVRERGYTRVFASHLIEGSPTLLIREMEVNGLHTGHLPGSSSDPAAGDTLDVRASNISTQPWLVAEPATVKVSSRGDTLHGSLTLAGLAAGASPDATSGVSVRYRGLPADLVAEQLKIAGQPPLKGGTMDIDASGSISAGAYIDLPMTVTIRNSVITIVGQAAKAGEDLVKTVAGGGDAKEAKAAPAPAQAPASAGIPLLVIPIGVRGPLDNPGIRFDPGDFADALAKSGAAELADRVRGEIGKVADKARQEAEGVGKKVQEKVEDVAKDALGGLLGDKKKKEKK